MTKKTTQFKRLLHSGKLEFLMEAHNGLTAKLVEEAGFKGIWASGLTLSAAMGVRDSNEASWTQVLEVVELMSDASSVPILLDADTGYGNFNNVRRLVRKLEQRNIPAMCIEDKVFPKTNSFLNEKHQLLADTEEFAGKIEAAKDTQEDSDFCLLLSGSRRHPRPQQALFSRPDTGIHESMERGLPRSHRPDHLLPDTGRGLRSRGSKYRDLGQSSFASIYRGDADRGFNHLPDWISRGCPGTHRVRQGNLPPAECR